MRWSGLLVVPVVWSVAACASFGGYPDYPLNVEADRATFRYYFQPSTIQWYLTAPPEMRRGIRNEIVFGRVAAYDIEFVEFQQKINAERALADTTGDLTGLVLTALGASLIPSGTTKALS